MAVEQPSNPVTENPDPAPTTINDDAPQSSDQLEDWLAKYCHAGDQSTNVTTFRGKKKDDYGNVIREGSWYLFDRYRQTFAEHFVRIYHAGKSLPCLNMLVPAGDGWRCKPYLDVDFANGAVFQRLLQHVQLQRDDFYRDVRRCFAKFVFQSEEEEDHDSNIAFSKQPNNDHKFHLIYIGTDNIVWTKTEMREKLIKFARFMTGWFGLEQLHQQQPIMVIYCFRSLNFDRSSAKTSLFSLAPRNSSICKKSERCASKTLGLQLR